MKTLLKFLGGTLVVAALVAVVSYGLLYVHNNQAAEPIAADQVRLRLAHSIDWLIAHRASIYRENNPVLWWMLREAGELNGDARLQELAGRYINEYRTNAFDSPWTLLFEPERGRNFPIDVDLTTALSDYQQYLLFSLTCNTQLSNRPSIERQHQVNYCRVHRPLSPACTTHQLMGFRFQQRIQCSLLPDLNQRVGALQNTVADQLRFDPRVVDVYIQRLLMLVDSDAAYQIQSRWLERAMTNQLADGGWDDLDPIITIGEIALGFDTSGFAMRKRTGNLHVTAQSVLLLSHLAARPNLMAQIGANQ